MKSPVSKSNAQVEAPCARDEADLILRTVEKPPDARGARDEHRPVNGANREASEQIKCASRSAMRERRSGFDIANCGKGGVHGTTPPNRLRRVAAQNNSLRRSRPKIRIKEIYKLSQNRRIRLASLTEVILGCEFCAARKMLICRCRIALRIAD